MLSVLAEIYIPLFSFLIFILGTGFFSTFLAIKMTMAQESVFLIGSLTGIFYAGLFIGSFRVERFIIRVGHIRAFAVFSAMLAVICLLHGIYYNAWFWLFLRFVSGLATAGIYVVIESWLMCKSTAINRGQVLSLYLIVFYVAQSFGQLILYFDDNHSMILFAVTSMLCSLSIIPLSMSSVRSPQFEEPSTLSLKLLLDKSTSGVLGSLASGLIMGAIYGLMPTYFSELFRSQEAVANYMFVLIFGGILLQYPLGRLSDLIERRLVLLMVSLATIVVSLLILLFQADGWQMVLLMGIFGGLTFTLHPISTSHAIDALDTKDIVAGSQSLLLVYSIGAMSGPFIAPVFMRLFGPTGLLLFFVAVCAVSAPIYIIRKVQKDDVPQEAPFRSIANTSPIIAEIDPRGEGYNFRLSGGSAQPEDD